jgi:aminopeptidase N
VEDSVYPDVGDPGVDALHYGLRLAWDDAARTLSGQESLTFRSTGTADHVQLDLEPQLAVRSVSLDGHRAEADHRGKDLVVHGDFVADRVYRLDLTWSGTPKPVPAPTTRSDFSTVGLTTTRSGEIWTMQEPYGAYTWYAVNDQPADKAYYDVTITAPAGMVGVSNGTLVSRSEQDGHTVTRWHLDEPAASYLTTLAVGRFTMTSDRTPSGLPVTYWTPKDDPAVLARVRYTPQAIDYLEQKLGPFPFSSLGVVVVPSSSAMETQSMLTLGNTPYTTERSTIVHELAHQWYGDEVTPADWRDVWMNEGMALYLAEGNWVADHEGKPLASVLAQWSGSEPLLRMQSGPPGAYDPSTFGQGNIYYGPALMWDEVRQRVGDATFWRLVREWPRAHAETSTDRAALVGWWSRQSGQDLAPLFRSWLMDRSSPRYTP